MAPSWNKLQLKSVILLQIYNVHMLVFSQIKSIEVSPHTLLSSLFKLSNSEVCPFCEDFPRLCDLNSLLIY